MLNAISNCSLLFHRDKYRQRWIFVIVVHAIWMFMGLSNPIVGYDVLKFTDWTPSWWFRSYVARAKYAFFLHNNKTLSTIRPPLSDITPIETLLGILQILVNATHDLHMRVMISAFGICCITIWTSVKNFEKVVTTLESHKEDFKELYRKFCSLRDLCDSINNVWHFYCYWYILDIIVWLATDLDRALRAQDYYLKVYMVYFMFYDGTVITLSAESFRKMHWFRQWIVNRASTETVQRKEIKFMLQEISLSTIGLGSSGFYQLDYSFMGKVSVMVVTFFIISLQYA
ncbi:unnamed protein product [Orchesella dallaii]|uniref:Gustatory receptor n=1 Tax=Orchesella dallaii TaxID=48710 RepID=A0ABP1RTI3_9HEXA